MIRIRAISGSVLEPDGAELDELVDFGHRHASPPQDPDEVDESDGERGVPVAAVGTTTDVAQQTLSLLPAQGVEAQTRPLGHLADPETTQARTRSPATSRNDRYRTSFVPSRRGRC